MIMKHLILLLLSALALAADVKGDTTLGTAANPATSCNEIYQHNPASRGIIGQYYIKIDHLVQKVTCNMKLKCGGLEGGWMQVANLDTTRDETCPGDWQSTTTPRRLCQGNDPAGCNSADFSTLNVTYEHICGQVKAYQKGSTNAFNIGTNSVDNVYVDGVSITLGSPRKHVWTFAVGASDHVSYTTFNCPCATFPGPSAPAFIGDDYYCESGNSGVIEFNPYYLSDPLWDGRGCDIRSGCCTEIGKPWFYRKLPIPTTGDFEVRICKDETHANENIAIEQLELYVRC